MNIEGRVGDGGRDCAKQLSVAEAKAALLDLVVHKAYQAGEFTLSSGQKSTFYLDLKQVTLHPLGALAVATLAWDLLDPRQYGGVGGPTLGADPLATTLSFSAKLFRGVDVPAFIVRKEPKKHGTSQWIEGRGHLREGSELLMLEDVVTTGGSFLRALEKVRQEGFVVKTLLAVLDRQQGASRALESVGVELKSLLTWEEVQRALKSGGNEG